MSEELPPMDDELRELLRAGAPPLVAPRGAETRLLARLGKSIPGLVDPPGGGGGGGGVGLSTGVKAAIGIAIGSAALVGVAAFGAGGKADTVSVRAPVVKTITAPATATPATSASNDVPTMNVDSLPSAPAARAPITPSATATGSSDAVAEHAILDEARNALGRGDAATALAAVERHQARYPQGALAEEREVLAIRALASSDRMNEAHARAARFKARHPQSMFLPAIDAALAPH
jgi:hypothetical protein